MPPINAFTTDDEGFEEAPDCWLKNPEAFSNGSVAEDNFSEVGDTAVFEVNNLALLKGREVVITPLIRITLIFPIVSTLAKTKIKPCR